MGKLFTEPLFIFILVQWAILGFQFRRLKPKIRNLLLFPLIVLSILSMPVFERLIEQSLLIKSNSCDPAIQPDAIVVLAGGYRRGMDPALDTLIGESAWRVMAGVDWWKKVHSSKLVMSGSSPSENPDHPQDRNTQLMAWMATVNGVPPSVIVQEKKSSNTREHPIQLIKLPGFNANTKIGIVTSPWHLRRALHEFKKYFKEVYTPPLCTQDVEHIRWVDWIPRVETLGASTTMLHEWIGLAWYRLKG